MKNLGLFSNLYILGFLCFVGVILFGVQVPRDSSPGFIAQVAFWSIFLEIQVFGVHIGVGI